MRNTLANPELTTLRHRVSAAVRCQLLMRQPDMETRLVISCKSPVRTAKHEAKSPASRPRGLPGDVGAGVRRVVGRQERLVGLLPELAELRQVGELQLRVLAVEADVVGQWGRGELG